MRVSGQRAVNTPAPVAVRPAVEAAVAHARQVAGHQITAELVTLVDHGPQHAVGREGHAVGIAQAAREQAFAAARTIDLPDRGAAFLVLHAVLGDVAVRADGCVQLAAVGAGDQRLGPVVVERPAGQVGHLASRRVDARLPGLVRELHHRVGVGDVEAIAHQGHAERRVQLVEEDAARFGTTVAAG
jgi:hypothetical protein